MKRKSSAGGALTFLSFLLLSTPLLTHCSGNHGKGKVVTQLPEVPLTEEADPTILPDTSAPETTPVHEDPATAVVAPEEPRPEVPVVVEPKPQTPVAPPVVVTPAPAAQIARFTVWLDAIEKDLLLVSAAEVPDRLYKNKAREKVFNMQALGRIYKDKGPAFQELHNRFKDLEDAIGDYQKWADYEVQGIANGEAESILAKLRANREAGRKHLVDSLYNSQFLPGRAGEIPYTVKLRAFLSSYAWDDAINDRKYVVKKLVSELEKTKTATYDFSHLESGNGVHEFRRKMRWFAMEARALDGLITLKPMTSGCPVASWAGMIHDSIARTKYAVLPPNANESNPISLSPCLYIKNARLVEDVNVFKAKAESSEVFSREESSDLMEESDRLLLEAIHEEVMAGDLFGRLQEELRAGLEAQRNTVDTP